MIPHSLRRQAPLAVFVLCFSLAGIGGAFVQVVHRMNEAGPAVGNATPSLVSTASLGAMGCLSLLFFASPSPAWFRAGMLLKTAGLALHQLTAPAPLLAEAALLSALLMEIAIYEAFFLNLIGSLAVVAFSTLVFPLGALTAAGLSPSAAAGLLAAVSGPLAVSWCLMVHFREKSIELTENAERLSGAVEKLAKASLGYQEYASEAAVRSQREERQRITRELHDVIGYTFTNNIMMLEAAVSKIHKDPAKVENLIALARENAKEGLATIRRSLHLLRSYERPKTSIRRIQDLVSVFRIATGVEVAVEYTNAPDRMGAGIEEFFHSFVQEALTNAFRHGQATRIRLYLTRTEDRLVASVLDNGRGAGEIREGLGITGMRERLAALGGTLTIARRPDGFQITGEVPYGKAEADD